MTSPLIKKPKIPQPPRMIGGNIDKNELKRWFDSIWISLSQFISVLWSDIDFTNSDLNDITTKNHSDLDGLTLSNAHPSYAISTGVIAKVTTYTISTTDETITFDPSGGDFTTTLPTAVGVTGRTYDLVHVGASGTLTIDGNGTETINGSLTIDIYSEESLTVRSDGTNWIVI